MNYWNNLAHRERWLLGSAVSLLLLMGLFFLVVNPILNSKTRAERAQESAQSDLALIKKNLPLLSGGSSTVSGTLKIDRNGIYTTAQSNGLEMSRFQPERDGAAKVWIEEATSAQVFKFVSDITSRYAATVSAAQITRKEGGKVNVTITFRPLGA